jgi:hypothetical protein
MTVGFMPILASLECGWLTISELQGAIILTCS